MNYKASNIYIKVNKKVSFISYYYALIINYKANNNYIK